ncbi:MAG: matrixin family metalloprotease [Candidatus Moranbacteria bacterium]|nr:matrixin family metalloprotease [Candidatus Moranbacteria bacterium]
MILKKALSYFFLVALAFGTIVIWQRVPLPCEQPIEYAIGNFDARFGISQEAFLTEATHAERLWEEALGRDLFRYVPEAAFKINFIFDIRQEQTVAGQKLDASFDTIQVTQNQLSKQQAATIALYEQTKSDYEWALVAFNKRLNAYTADVKKWNKRGGAPQDEYENLQAEVEALEQEQPLLESKRQEVNRLANEVNGFSEKKVAVVEEYNERVEAYVNRFGEPQEFDQGDYMGKEINIYQYEDFPHLRVVLAHEFGHALGLTHGTDSTSIMFHLMKNQSLSPLSLSFEDRTMLSVRCRKNVWDIFLERWHILSERTLQAQDS